MRGVLCNTTAKTNEEYRKVIRRRMRISLLIGLIGIVTLSVAILVKLYWKTEVEEYMINFYSGFGAALLVVSAILWIKNMRTLRDEEKLKESRLINSDERIQEISNKAYRSAALIMLVLMYGIILIGGLFYPILAQTLSLLLCVFLLTYTVVYRIYDKRM